MKLNQPWWYIWQWRFWFYPGGTGCLEPGEWLLGIGPVEFRGEPDD